MSEEMAVSDNATGEDAPPIQSDDATVETVAEAAEVPSEQRIAEPVEHPGDPQAIPEVAEILQPDTVKQEPDPEPEQSSDPAETEILVKDEILDTEVPLMDIKDEFEATDNMEYSEEDDKRGIKRRASDAFDDDVEFKGFEKIEDFPQLEYSLILERLEAEVTAASKGFQPVRTVMATPTAPVRASKRPRKDTDGSRPSSALSSRSESDDVNPAASPAQRGRRTTSEMSSPLFRVPIELGWKRELVYRAALDAHSRRNADIYYYTPAGKKLRSMREVGEHLSGTGLTLDNFTFFKEPLGLDDPEKEIIRDAKLVGGYRRVESPIASPAPTVDGKRTPKPKQPKGASPEPATPKSPPAKLRVKSVGSRLSGPPVPPKKKGSPAPAPPAPTPAPATPDNNNSAAWKKPRAPPPAIEDRPATPPVQPVQPPVVQPAQLPVVQPVQPPRLITPPPPPPLQSKPQLMSPDVQSPRQLVQPCSMSCGSGVPSLSCNACLCLYHPACAGFKHAPPPAGFLCKNCRKSSSPPHEPPPLTHKSGAAGASLAPAPRRLAPQPSTHKPNDKRVLLRMKVSGGGADGERVWAVAAPRPPRPSAPAGVPRVMALPQSLAVINGRRFIIVPRPAPLPNAAQAVAK